MKVAAAWTSGVTVLHRDLQSWARFGGDLLVTTRPLCVEKKIKELTFKMDLIGGDLGASVRLLPLWRDSSCVLYWYGSNEGV